MPERCACQRIHICVTRKEICDRYIANPITTAIVFGGLEPLYSKYAKEIKEKLRGNGGYCQCRLIKNADTKSM